MKMFVLLSMLAFSLGVVFPLSASAASTSAANAEFQSLPKPGNKVPLGSGHYFTFGFEKAPKLGNAIMKVEIFTLDGKRDRSFAVKGDVDMPSMRGAHSSGGKSFALSAKGVYLMPVQLVMPGDWEFRFTFEKSGKSVFRGAYRFDI
jgi:hypothetical protein